MLGSTAEYLFFGLSDSVLLHVFTLFGLYVYPGLQSDFSRLFVLPHRPFPATLRMVMEFGYAIVVASFMDLVTPC